MVVWLHWSLNARVERAFKELFTHGLSDTKVKFSNIWITGHCDSPHMQTTYTNRDCVPSAPICKQSIDRSLYSALLAASFCLSKVKQSKVTQISSNLGRYVGIWLYSKRLMSYGMRMKPKNDAVQTGWFMHAWRIRKLSASFFLVVLWSQDVSSCLYIRFPVSLQLILNPWN